MGFICGQTTSHQSFLFSPHKLSEHTHTRTARHHKYPKLPEHTHKDVRHNNNTTPQLIKQSRPSPVLLLLPPAAQNARQKTGFFSVFSGPPRRPALDLNRVLIDPWIGGGLRLSPTARRRRRRYHGLQRFAIVILLEPVFQTHLAPAFFALVAIGQIQLRLAAGGLAFLDGFGDTLSGVAHVVVYGVVQRARGSCRRHTQTLLALRAHHNRHVAGVRVGTAVRGVRPVVQAKYLEICRKYGV